MPDGCSPCLCMRKDIGTYIHINKSVNITKVQCEYEHADKAMYKHILNKKWVEFSSFPVWVSIRTTLSISF